MRTSGYPSRYIAAACGGTLATLAALGVSTPAAAQSVPGESTFVLGTVEVIGKREAIAPAPTTDTVDLATLLAKHRDDLSEALDLIPGISIQNTGQRRERLISLRGFTSRQVPLFIDGVPVYVPYDGNVDLARFGVDYVSKIIVGKGLASLLYGPNILGGAINVVSRKPTQPFEAFARLASEADDRLNSTDQRVSASLGGTSGLWYGTVTASYSHSDGYRLPADFVPVAAENGGDRENATSHDSVISAKIGFAPNDDNEFALTYYRQDGEKRDPPYAGSYLRTNSRLDGVQVRYWTWPYWDKESVYLVARNAVGSQGTLRWRLFHDSFRNALESFDDATYTTQTRPFAFHGSHYDDYTYGGSADFEWNWSSAHTTRLATHYRQDVHREAQTAPAIPLQRLEIPTYDVAIEHEWQIAPNFTLTPSYSHMIQPDQTVQVYNSNTRTYSPVSTNKSEANNAQLVGTYKLDAAGSFVAGISRKTRFPTLKERFSGGLGSAVPNPALDPETATHYEIGYETKGADWSTKIALFQSNLHDAIQAITLPATACTVPPCTQLQNIGRQRNRGVELSGNFAPVSTLQLSGQVNIVTIDLSNSAIRPTNTPEYKYLLAGDWQFLQQWRWSVDAQHESKRYSNSTGTRVAGSFTLVNSFVRFAPVARLGVEVGVRNLTDQLYAYEEGFFEAGRTWLGQIDYRF